MTTCHKVQARVRELQQAHTEMITGSDKRPRGLPNTPDRSDRTLYHWSLTTLRPTFDFPPLIKK
jgi:hypothetical protein